MLERIGRSSRAWKPNLLDLHTRGAKPVGGVSRLGWQHHDGIHITLSKRLIEPRDAIMRSRIDRVMYNCE